MQAGQQWLWGAEGGSRFGYGYLGYTAPFLAGGDERSYLQRYWVDWVDYRYDSDGREIRATAPGLEALLGRRLTDGGANELTLYGGLSYRDTSISPSDANVDVKGGRLGVKVQLEGAWAGKARRLEGIAAYIAGPDSYWVRGRGWIGDTAAYRYGVEAVSAGDPDYSAYQFGLLVGHGFSGTQGQWVLKAGFRHSSGVADSGYVGIEAQLAR